jgi:hypothetical protein
MARRPIAAIPMAFREMPPCPDQGSRRFPYRSSRPPLSSPQDMLIDISSHKQAVTASAGLES